ncbi:uncharacterized protein ACLA_038740 [Aspergillus clavatus NRRL 1]|uniref:Uncharacterized protein n=1 Tax=Aspergillus clavatus (strain ATCC 1007 / CBS 513.65 / DSM 816 / NCTC 3887 / NRRL 1 / QM 1276 / 107) TaxID=344612 RepID=A1CKI5_ASPCL|nr:uncharacterized protein ACLA_038740 [Aspergillus clavatus NRRL 1]EAW09659.1 conserved hypothetical protein [Aspergillus clavatus NRRL 1]
MEDIRPTAKWANRMLRPLASIYHRLEKHQEILSSIAHSKRKERAESADTERTKAARVAGAAESCPDSDEEPDDPAWVPGRPEKRRIRHNYSSRGQRNGGRRRSRLLIRSPEVQRTLPGAIEIATPLITGKMRLMGTGFSTRKQLFGVEGCVESSVDGQAQGSSGGGGGGLGRKPTRTNNSSFPAYQGSWKEVLDLSGDTGMVDIAHLLDRIFLKFLHNTRVNVAGPQQQQGRGARSLVSMIARRLPEFIAGEQDLQDEEDENDGVDMCDAYFTELEAYYAPLGNGWEPLREAVRSQGINLVAQMMEKNWITRLAACRLMEECIRHSEFDAFKLMISRYLSSMDSYDYPTAFDPQRPSNHCDDPIYILRTYYSWSNDCRAFVYDELAKLLLRSVLPSEWMVTTWWKKCVDGAVKSVSTKDSDSAAANRLIEAIILSAGGVYSSVEATVPQRNSSSQQLSSRTRGTRTSAAANTLPIDHTPCPVTVQDALSNLISSLITALCGMYMARSTATDVSEKLLGLKVGNTLSCLALTLERDIGLSHQQDQRDLPPHHSLRRGYVLLGNCMVQIGEGMPSSTGAPSDVISKQRLEAFLVSIVLQQDMLKEMADLVQRVCRYCGYSTLTEHTRTPLEIRRKVTQLAQQAGVRGQSFFLGKIAAETAMALAEKTLDPDDHIWAAQVQESVVSAQQGYGTRPDLSSESDRDARPGMFRWEESIGEWVASTPKTRPGQMDEASNQGSSESRHSSPDSPSTQSVSSSSTPSVHSASSATSSAPSVPAKRAFAGNRLAFRPMKRLRSRTVETYMDEANDQTFNAGHRLSFLSSRPCPLPEAQFVPVAARTRSARGVLGELVHARNVPNRAVVTGIKPATSSPKLEVVIVNRKDDLLLLDEPTETNSDCDLEICDPSSQEACPTTISKVHNLRQRSFRRTRSFSRMQRTISCSQDDESEDELSFL